MDAALIEIDRAETVSARARWRWQGAMGAERGRLFLFLPVFAGAGILGYFDLIREPSVWVWLVAAGVCAAALVLSWRWNVARGVAGLALAAVLGFGRAQVQTLAMPPLMAVARHAVTIGGVVGSVEIVPTGRRITVLRPVLDGVVQARAVRVKLRRGDGVAVEAGDRVRVRALLYGASRPAYPGGWFFGRDQFFAGLGAVGFAISPLDVTARAAPGWLGALRRLREGIAARIMAVLPVDTGSVAATLMTGSEAAIPGGERQEFVTAGLAHILAVAGLHIGIVMGTLYALTRFLVGFSEYLLLRVPAKIVASVVSFAGGVVYAALTGFHVPIVRSLAMAGLVLAGVVAGRRALSLRGLALAALALMLIEPQAVPGPSFQMSFSAVLALIAGYEAVGRRFFSVGGDGVGARLGRHAVALGFTSLLAGGASMPFAAYHFQQIEPYYVLANLIAVPVTALVVLPFGMASLVLMPVHLERLALVPMGWGISVILWVARLVGGLPHALIEISPSPGYAVALVGVGLAVLGLLRSRLRWAGCVGIGLGVVLMMGGRAPDVVVSPTGALVGVRDGGVVRIVEAGRVDKFTLGQWRPVWAGDRVVAGRAGDVCLGGRCRFDGGRVLYVADRAAAGRGCGGAVVVVSPRPLRGVCRRRGRILIDRFSVWRDGAMAVWLEHGRVRVRTDRMVQGDRPWVPAWPVRWHRDANRH